MSQRVYILVKRDGPVRNAKIYAKGDTFLSQPWFFDLQGDLQIKEYHFTRRPVIIQADIDVRGESRPIFFTAIHSKSKFIQNGEQLWGGSADEKKQFIRKSIENRRKIASEW